MSWSASVVVPTPLSPAIDPSQTGIRVELVDAQETVLDSLTLAGGLRDPAHPIGWSANHSRTRWRYADRTGTGRVRTAQLVVDDLTGRVAVRLTASGGTVAFTPANAPLGIRMLVSTTPRRCGALMFDPLGQTPTCKFSRTGASVQCR